MTTTTTMMTMTIGMIGDSGNVTKKVFSGTLGKWKAKKAIAMNMEVLGLSYNIDTLIN